MLGLVHACAIKSDGAYVNIFMSQNVAFMYSFDVAARGEQHLNAELATYQCNKLNVSLCQRNSKYKEKGSVGSE